MSDNMENKTLNKAVPLRDAHSDEEKTSRSSKKAPSLREETYKPADPNKPAPKTIILDDSAFIPKKSMRDIAAQEMTHRRDRNVSSSFRSLDSEAINQRKIVSFMDSFDDSEDDYETEFNADESDALRSYRDHQVDDYKNKGFSDEDFAEDDFEDEDLSDEYEDDSRPSKPGLSAAFKGFKNRTSGDKQSESILDRLKSIPFIEKHGKKLLIAIAALIVIIILIAVIFGGSSFKNVGAITIDSTASTQTLSWSGSKKGMTYEVYRTNAATGETKLVDTLTNGENSIRYDGLDGGTLYRYTIVTVNKKGEKTEGTTAEDSTKPNTVTNTSAVTKKENSLTVSWTLAGAATGYELQYGLVDNLVDAVTVSLSSDLVTSNGDNTYNCTIDGLVYGNTYYIRMRTICGENSSEWCNVFSAEVTDPVIGGNVDSGQPMVALTFDSGPDGNGVTDRILDILLEYNSHATFFQTGENAAAYPELMQRMVNEGNEVGNHTYDDSHVGGEVTTDDITNANDAILAACGVSPKLFRAPQGEITDSIINSCSDNGMVLIQWNFDSHDWEYYDPQEIVDRVELYVEDGDIIQFKNKYEETASAIEVLVPYLIEEGYQIVTVSQLIEAKTGSSPQVGTIYYSGYQYE